MTQQLRRTVVWVIYLGLAILLLCVTTGLLASILPARWATRVAYNSEAYLFALVLAPWIQFGLQRIAKERWLTVGVALGLCWAAVGLGLLVSDLPSRVRTLNEPALALALLIPYFSIKRPLPQWSKLSIPFLLLLIALGISQEPQGVLVELAESLGFIILAIITLDVVDRPLLERNRERNLPLCGAWLAFLLLEPVGVSALGTGARGDEGVLPMTLQFLGRIHESFIGVVLVWFVLHIVREGGHRGRPDYSTT